MTVKLLLAVVGLLVLMGVCASLIGTTLAAACARCRPLDEEELSPDRGGWAEW